jgi:hypothetical protein
MTGIQLGNHSGTVYRREENPKRENGPEDSVFPPSLARKEDRGKGQPGEQDNEQRDEILEERPCPDQ